MTFIYVVKDIMIIIVQFVVTYSTWLRNLIAVQTIAVKKRGWLREHWITDRLFFVSQLTEKS